MVVSSERELNTLRECGRRLGEINRKLIAAVKPGVSALELDGLAEALILSMGGSPAFKGYRSSRDEKPFPASLCVSVNDEVVHAVPRKEKVVEEGDIVSLDFGMRYPARGGLITDMAVTVTVGRVLAEAERLVAVTREALELAVGKLKAGMALGDIGALIQEHIEVNGFSVVRELMGHGVGRALHENPNVPNYGLPGQGEIVRANSVLAIEPMATAGSPVVVSDNDGWTWRTRDGSPAAHFEHTVFVGGERTEILTKL